MNDILFGSSFHVSYENVLFQAMVSVQMLSELEEIIQFKLVPERREAIKRTWWNRLQVRRNVTFVGLDIKKTTPLPLPSPEILL